MMQVCLSSVVANHVGCTKLIFLFFFKNAEMLVQLDELGKLKM